MKKLLSTLLVVVLVLTMSVSAMAAMEGTLTGGTITINDAISGQTYDIYQILYLESYNKDAGAYAYKANSAWADWLKTQTTYVSIDDQGYVTWVTGASVADFAAASQAYAKDNKIPADKTAKADSTTVNFTDLKLGYYLVDTTLGTLCSLDTTNPAVVIEEKNEAPTVTKEVEEDSDKSWGASNDADINQTVNYKATITVQAGAENYILHDTMGKGLTFDASTVKVTVDGTKITTGYTLVENPNDGCTFEVQFDNDYIATLDAGTKIVVTYSAALDEDAVVGLEGNTNTIKLQYGDKNHPSYTPDKVTTTYTWDAKVIKFTKNGETEVLLAGATFKLSTDEKGENIIKFHSLGENKYEVCADAACTEEHVTKITTDSTGKFNIEGLDSGTYYLTETAAPAGYNKLAGPVTVEITGATTAEGSTELTYTTVETKVQNNSGTELPSTGGIGTTIFYIAGGLMMAAAVVLLVTKKRMKTEG